MKIEKVHDNIIEKAVDIWCKALHNPKFDNGDKSETGFLGMALASMNCDHDKNTISMEDAVEKFRNKLISSLKIKRDNDKYFSAWLDTDYGPCQELSEAAEGTGIKNSMFSIKSQVMINSDCVVSRFGYGASSTYCWPVSDGRWVLTKSHLSPEERGAILAAILDGRLEGFTVEVN